jgi:hypothetical protein
MTVDSSNKSHVLAHFVSPLSLIPRDADFMFATLMEHEKTCMGTINDPAKAQATFLSTAVSKFTKEGFNMMQRYCDTMSDVKDLMNLQRRAQKFTDAGSGTASQAMDEKDNPRERLAMLAARRVKAPRMFESEVLGLALNFHPCLLTF